MSEHGFFSFNSVSGVTVLAFPTGFLVAIVPDERGVFWDFNLKIFL